MDFYDSIEQKFQIEFNFYTFLKAALIDDLRDTLHALFHELLERGDWQTFAIRLERIRALGGHYNRRLQMIQNRRVWWDDHREGYDPEDPELFYEQLSHYLQDHGFPYFDIPDLEDTLTVQEALMRYQNFSQTQIFQDAFNHYISKLGPPGDDPSRTLRPLL